MFYKNRMELTRQHDERIAHCYPKHRRSLKYSNLSALNVILYIAENGAKWGGLPGKFGIWHTIYTRLRRWARSGVLSRAYEFLQQEQNRRHLIVTIKGLPPGFGRR